MTFTEAEAKEFQSKLMQWFSAHHRKLPWRSTRDPYRIWVSEIMLQQTTVRAVIPYYERWIAWFPDIRTLSRAPLQRVLKAWEGLGYYQRVKNLHRAARIVVARHGGVLPQSEEELRRLPGFGPYTTSAVLSLAFGRPHPVLDANVRRVMMRLGRIRGKGGPGTDRRLLETLRSLISHRHPGRFNQALMELGSTVCRSKNPLCLLCPVTKFCLAYKAGEQEVIPTPRKRTYKDIEAVVGVVENQGRFLIQKRPEKGLLAGLWEFPGGKIEPGETPVEALRRELREELDAEVESETHLLSLRHAYTRYRVRLHAFLCRLRGRPRPKSRNHCWIEPENLKKYPFPSGSAKIVRVLEERAALKKPSSVKKKGKT